MYWKQRTKVPLQTLTDYNKYIFTIILEYKNTGNNEKKRLKHKKINHYARLSGKVYFTGRETKSPGLEALFINHTPDK